MQGTILAVGLFAVFPPPLNSPCGRKNKANPACCSVTEQELGASHPRSLQKVKQSLNLFCNQQNPGYHHQNYCCCSKAKETQSLGQSDRENWTVETMNFAVSSCWATRMTGVLYIFHRQSERLFLLHYHRAEVQQSYLLF